MAAAGTHKAKALKCAFGTPHSNLATAISLLVVLLGPFLPFFSGGESLPSESVIPALSTSFHISTASCAPIDFVDSLDTGSCQNST